MNNMDKSELFDEICNHASPHIRMSYVVGENEQLLLNFHIHPQMQDHFITLDEITTDTREILISTDDARDLADKITEFANIADEIICNFNELREKQDGNK